jgi:phosphoglycerate dehydrogenase-like enzyme
MPTSDTPSFQLGLSAELLDTDGNVRFGDIGLEILDDPAIAYRFFERDHIVKPEQIAGLDAVIPVHEHYTPELLLQSPQLLAIICFGVGYDHVDVDGCTAADVVLCNQRGAGSNAMAESIVVWMLTLAHRVIDKDQLARQGLWSKAAEFNGIELRDRTLGIVGLGGVGTRLVEMLQGFRMNPPIGHDPYVTTEQAARLGIRWVPLDELLRESDFVAICCPLSDKTHDLIGRDELQLMKPTAALINTARGGIVNEAALVEALTENWIAGAAVDVFEEEPAAADHPYTGLDNIVLAPHCIGWTQELFRDIGHMAFHKVISLAAGQVPDDIINPDVLERPGFLDKLTRFQP